MEQFIGHISPALINALSLIIIACLGWLTARITKYINSMNISETFKTDFQKSNDLMLTSTKKIIAGVGNSLKQKLADGKLTEKELSALQHDIYTDVKQQMPDIEKRLDAHLNNGAQYVADTILGNIESANKITGV